ncbi:signaling protein [Acidiphilium multivorum AIU301]|nr:signaling protein [Acidiphilium multivorum AIU301]
MTIGASIGAAMLPSDANSPAGAHHCADIALYQAKVEGRGKFCFFDARTQDAISKRITIHTDLKSPAVRQQLFLEYQPIIDLRTGKPIAMEALVRWQHPVRGVINPTDFISIAEDSGFINVIGKHVIDMTCRSAALMTPNLEFAINLSPRQLRDEMLPDKISEVLRKNDIDGRRISFEITETCLLDVGGNSLGLLDKIRALGCRIVLDDFGTGYSSFRPLHNYDFDRIKIAQALLDDVFLSPSRQIILETVVAMGQRIGIDMIAEGVETEQQAALLRSLDCPFAQGFWFSRPISDTQLIREYGVANTL